MSVVVEHLGHVTQLTLDRQDAANAINIEMAIGIAEAIDAFAADPNARVLVVTGPAATARILWPSSRRRGSSSPWRSTTAMERWPHPSAFSGLPVTFHVDAWDAVLRTVVGGGGDTCADDAADCGAPAE